MQAINSWAICSAQARDIVRAVLTPHAVAGLRAQQIYHTGLSDFPDAREPPPPPRGPPGSEPPNLGHPLRSMSFLKRVVLSDMMTRGEVERIHIHPGKLNLDGVRVNIVSSKGYDKTFVENAVTEKYEWRWRLMPEDKIEHHKEVVERLHLVRKPGFRKAKAQAKALARLKRSQA